MAALRATSSMWPSLLLLLIVGLSAASMRPAHAQDARQSGLARSLFEEGVSLGDRGDWVGAEDRFARAYSLKPTSAVAYNWASALIELRRLVEARELLYAVQRDQAASAELRRAASDLLESNAPRIAHLRVHVSTAGGDGLTVDLDERPLPRAAWGVPSPVDPGSHTVVLRERGDERARANVTLAEGEQRDVALSFEHRAAAPAPPVAPSAPSRDQPLYKNWKLWTAVGAAVAVGVVVAVVVVAKHDDGAQPAHGNAMPGVIRW
ncbi:MAG TPA: hypothetical protein VI299_17350 [Polyangiales bacterium]